MNYRIVEMSTADEFMGQLDNFESCQELLLVVNTSVRSRKALIEGLIQAEAVAADFDNTLIAGTQWDDFRAIYGEKHPELLVEDDKSASSYFTGGRISDRTIELALNNFSRLIRGEISIPEMAARAAKRTPRPGVIDLFRSFDEDKRCIISFGIEQFISFWSAVHIGSTQVFALELVFDDDHQATGFNCRTVVTDHNKGYLAAVFRVTCKVSRDKLLTIGDAPTDRLLLRHENISVFIYPRNDISKTRCTFRRDGIPELWGEVSAFIIGDSLEPLVDLRLRSSAAPA